MAETGTGRATIGARVPRVETRRYVRGAGAYVDDRQAEGMLHLAFVRSSWPAGRILEVDVSAAAALPGVVLALTGRDLAGRLQPLRGHGSPRVEQVVSYPLAVDRVHFVGEAVAVVAAEDRYTAEDAAELVAATYEPGPAVTDAEAALRPSAPRVFEELPDNRVYEAHFDSGGVDEAFASAAAVVELRVHSGRAAACPMEPRAYAAEPDRRTGGLVIWSTTTNPFTVRNEIARSLGLPEGLVRVICPDVGGSFGAKNSTYPEEVLVALVAHRTGRPAKWTELRTEHLRVTRQGRDQLHYIRGAFAADGRLLAIDDRIVADLGAASSVDNSVGATVAYVPGPYDVRAYRVDAVGAATHKPAHGSLRGIGKADAAFVVERLMDHAAVRLGIDPAEIRLRNLVDEDSFPYRTVTGALLDSGRYKQCLRRALDLAGYDRLRTEAAEARSRGVHQGVGVSFVIEPTAASRRSGGSFSSCRLTVNPSGRIFVQSGTAQQGQGHETTVAQIVADRLSVPFDRVDVFQSDTHVSPYAFGTGSSRSSTVLMSAVFAAAEKMRAKLVAIAAHRLGVEASAVACEEGRFRAPGGETIDLAQIARIAYMAVDRLPPGMEPGLEVTGTFVNPNIDYDPDELGRYNAFSAYPYDAAVAVVQVDPGSGAVRLRKYVSVHDCGTQINPTVASTQHLGATVQGFGLALLEELPYDADGQPRAASFMDYLLPTAFELPDEAIFDHMVTPSPFTPLGAKGAGETGTLSPPAAIAGAIEDSLRPLRVQLLETPFSGQRVVEAVRRAEQGA